MFQRAIIVLLLLPLISCGGGGGFFKGSKGVNAKGVNYGTAEMDMETAYDNLKNSLELNKNISIIAELDHSKNEASTEMTLRPSRIIFFGNPKIGTLLMLQNQLAGLDLPLRVLFFEEDEQVFALYNNASYLEQRYNLDDQSTLNKISANLEELVGKSLNTEIIRGEKPDIINSQGIKTVQSRRDFNETWTALKDILEDNENIKIVAELDHRANAAGAGMELRPTRLIMFGNPNLGTPLMHSAISTGLDLPKKILVWQDEEGEVNISYNAPEFLQFRHGFKGWGTELEAISTVLNDLARTAGGL